MPRKLKIFCCALAFMALLGQGDKVAAAVSHVILISVDGLRSDAITTLNWEAAPHLYIMMDEGASTLNARTDTDRTNTLPNHTCMLTGRGVIGENGHGYTVNDDKPLTIHDLKGGYVSSIFNVLSPALKRSGVLASKSKFVIYPRSYGCRGLEGYPDYRYQDAQLIDTCKINDLDDEATVKAARQLLQKNTPSFLFIHLAGPDRVGHSQGWDITPGSAYHKEVQNQDQLVGQIMKAIQDNAALANSTVIILTSDHGGLGKDHQDVNEPKDFTIPFIVWGKAVASASDLYELNLGNRQDPGDKQMPYSEKIQPIRNGDAANLALYLLGLPPIPGSTINAHQELNVFPMN